MLRAAISTWIAVLAACAPQPDPSVPVEPVVDHMNVALSAASSDAFEQVKTAFIGEGLQLVTASADGGLIVSVPVKFRLGKTLAPEYTYRAVIIKAAGGSVVTLNATLQLPKQGEYSSATTVPLTSVCKRYPTNDCSEAWAKLESLAAKIRGT